MSASGTASWVFRYRRAGKLREMGLGSAAIFGLADARQRAVQQRRILADGLDPIDARRAAQSVTGRTWGEAVDDFIEAHAPGWKTDAQADQWRQSLKDYGPDRAGLVAALDTAEVVRLLRKVWTTKTETATRVRGRMERVWDSERVAGHVTGDNPARWRGHLDKLLAKPSKVATPQHFRAMPFADVPALYRRLCERDGLARLALRFTILTAARTGEVTGAAWSEFEGDVWTIPGTRMKAGRPHVVPLVPQAVAILDKLPKDKPPFPLSENGMLVLLQNKPPKGFGLPFTVHGFRSSFRDWASETTDFPHAVVEMALAHTISNKTEAAYRRGNLLAKRRELMQAWADELADRL
ncbi:MAG: integrase arm-type DNA-binding domain-containing protein [Pseudomonadota bacterium]|nr:integrase arm-type DNA-binding domain-containing protein [Pseudomonadota bacterium]